MEMRENSPPKNGIPGLLSEGGLCLENTVCIDGTVLVGNATSHMELVSLGKLGASGVLAIAGQDEPVLLGSPPRWRGGSNEG